LFSFSGYAQLYCKPHFKVYPVPLCFLAWECARCSFCMPHVLLISLINFNLNEQKMPKLWSEDSELTSIWGDLYFLTGSIVILCGICNFLGCYSTGIIFMDWPRYPCKFQILVAARWVFLLLFQFLNSSLYCLRCFE